MRELRYERKFRLEHADHHLVNAMIRNHPAGFTRHYPDRVVQNIYFDTPELNTFNDNMYGVSERAKYRLRWYGEKQLPQGKSFWETKRKINTLGMKDVKAIDIDAGSSLDAIQHLVNIRSGLTYPLVPVLLNAYERTYFRSRNSKFRVTIDRALRFYPLGGRIRPTGMPFRMSDVIVELKYDIAHDDAANDIMKHIPLRQTKSSKYAIGVAMMP